MTADRHPRASSIILVMVLVTLAVVCLIATLAAFLAAA